MTNRHAAPLGAPCWVDLWTSDVQGSRQFYAGLFGWQAEEPSIDHGGYFMFTRAGVPVAGAMGDMGEARANNTWKPFFATQDIERTLKLATAHGDYPDPGNSGGLALTTAEPPFPIGCCTARWVPPQRGSAMSGWSWRPWNGSLTGTHRAGSTPGRA